MEGKTNATRLLLISLFLFNIQFLCWGVTADNTKNVSSLEELVEVLQTPLKSGSGEPKGIYIENDIDVYEPLLVLNTTPFRIYGHSFIRKAGYGGSIFVLEDGTDLTLECNIDCNNVISNEPEIVVKAGGTLRINGTEIVNVYHSKYLMGVIHNAGTMQMLKGTISTPKTTEAIFDVFFYNLLNTGTLELQGGTITDWIKDSGQTIIYGNDGLNIDGFLFGKNPIQIASQLKKEIKVNKGNPLAPHSGFNGKDIVAIGTSSYNVTQNDANMLSLNSNLEKTVVDNSIILNGDSGNEIVITFDLQREIDNASGTFGTTTTITIPEKGITLSAPVIVDGKYVKITGGTIKADFSETNLLTLFELKSGYLTLENITLDGSKTATADNWCTFIRQSGGSCYLERGTVLTNARGHWDRYNGILVSGGYCYLNKGARIELNTYGIGGTVLVEGDGHFSISDGIMYANEDGNGSNIENDIAHPRFGTIYIGKGGNMTFYSGEVSHDYVSIGVVGNLTYGTVDNARLFTDYIKMFKGGTITLAASLSNRVNMLFDDNVADGDIIVRGADSHQLTASDLVCFKLPDGYSLKAVGNTFVLSKTGTAGGITTIDELQAAIDAADAGTAANPTELTIGSKTIDFNKTVTIKGKHIKLKGENVVYQNVITSNIRLFSVESKGSLTIENATLLGTKTGTNAYCSFIYVDFGSTVTLNKVTMKKSLSDSKTWTMLRINGSCILKDCIISENNGTGLLYIGASANCRIEGGKIQNNSCTDGQYVYSLIINLGTLEYVSGEYTSNHAISISSDGTTTLRSPQIKNYLSTYVKDEGGAIWLSGSLNLYNTATIGDSFYLDKSGSRRGFLKIHGALKSNIGLVCHSAEDGWVVAEGDGYTLTQADLQKFILTSALAKEYTLKQHNNTFMLVALKGKTYNVKTETCVNGKITTDKATAAKDEMVTVTATPSAGYKLYSEKLCYNKGNKMQATNKSNVFTFKMPAADVSISAEFIPDDVNVSPVDTSKFDPDNDIIPDTGIGNLDSLIIILGGDPKDIVPKSEPVPESELPGILQDEVSDAKSKGDEVVGSLQELIDILSKTSAGQSEDKKTYYELPVKVTLTFYLPAKVTIQGLRSSDSGNYYILNESQGKITRIVPTYDSELNALIFETNKLGTFTVLRSGSSTANEAISTQSIKVGSFDNNIVIHNLPAGKPYAIYSLSGQLLVAGTGNGSIIRYRPKESGTYIVRYEGGAQKVYTW